MNISLLVYVLFQDELIFSYFGKKAGMGIGRDCQSQGYFSHGLESQSSESRDWPNDFCPVGLESQLVPNLLGIKMSQRFLFRDCLSDICPSPKHLKRNSPSPTPKYRDLCPGPQIPWHPSPIPHLLKKDFRLEFHENSVLF